MPTTRPHMFLVSTLLTLQGESCGGCCPRFETAADCYFRMCYVTATRTEDGFFDASGYQSGFQRYALKICFVAQCCPDLWTSYGGSCYALLDTPATWAEGEELCETFESHLATIDSEEENTFIQHFLQSKHLSVKHTWLGGNDLLMEGHWFWQDGGQQLKDFSDWCPGEPDNLGGQDCMALTLSKGSSFTCNWDWDDEACSSRYSVLCEQLDADKYLIG